MARTRDEAVRKQLSYAGSAVEIAGLAMFLPAGWWQYFRESNVGPQGLKKQNQAAKPKEDIMMKKTLVMAVALSLTAGMASAQITVIGGAIGNGNFNAGGGGTAGPAQTYDQTANWFNAGGADTINFTQSSQMGGSTDPDNGTTTRGGMPFKDRTQVNNTGYTILGAGQVFSLSYDFGAGGAIGQWTNTADQVMNTFIFTTGVAVDDAITTGDMTQVAGANDAYAIDRANDGQWTTRTVANLYTTTLADVGKTVYFGMVFDQGTGANDLFPRIDVVNLQVTPVPEPATLSLMALAGGALLLARRRTPRA